MSDVQFTWNPAAGIRYLCLSETVPILLPVRGYEACTAEEAAHVYRSFLTLIDAIPPGWDGQVLVLTPDGECTPQEPPVVFFGLLDENDTV